MEYRRSGAKTVSLNDKGELSSIEFFPVDMTSTFNEAINAVEEEVEREILDELPEEQRDKVKKSRQDKMRYYSSR